MNSRGICLLVALCYAITAGNVHAQQDDVTFFVIGKHTNNLQDDSGARHSVDYSFFSEIFLTSGGDVYDATLTFPTGERVDFKDMRNAEGGSEDNTLVYMGTDRFTELAELQRRYPDGTYQVSFGSPSGTIDAATLRFENRGLPDAPPVEISQGDVRHCVQLAANQDMVVTWGSFSQGAADKNGILDDLVFVILTDSNGIRVAHSGRPFEERPYLTYADSSFTVTADALRADEDYTLVVEHAILDDTIRLGGVPAFTTRAVSTKLKISTGPAGTKSCTAGKIAALTESTGQR